MKPQHLNRRSFLRHAALAAGLPFLARAERIFASDLATASLPSSVRSRAAVAIVSCKTYGTEVRTALRKSFDLLGGIGSLVRGKTVTVKLNLTGSSFQSFLGRPVGETYMTHYATAYALASALFEAGAQRVRFVESASRREPLETILSRADWDVRALNALGKVEFENTRNLGNGKRYADLKVAGGGFMFSSFELNHAYHDTDVMVSLAKLKNHLTAGVTLTMKNLFGITPNSLYSADAGDEDATGGRGVMHAPRGSGPQHLPGLKSGITQSSDPTVRVPRIVADICAARPIDLAIIDGITSMAGGEGPWCERAAKIRFMQPGVLIAGLNPVSTDAVGVAVMGYADPAAPRGKAPFTHCDNHLALAEQVDLGTADLRQIEVRGVTIAQALCPYDPAVTQGG